MVSLIYQFQLEWSLYPALLLCYYGNHTRKPWIQESLHKSLRLLNNASKCFSTQDCKKKKRSESQKNLVKELSDKKLFDEL